MIFEAVQIIEEQVNAYFEECGLAKSVIAENIGILETSSDAVARIEDKVALTLLNLGEETTLKNFPNQIKEGSKVVYKNNIVNLNLYILFSANRNTYVKSLNDISKIIEFFQGKKLFTQANTVYDRNNTTMANIENFRFTVELYTPTFEEMNFIWGTLGGRQLPSALYKVSMIQIERDIVQSEGQLISKIEGLTNQYLSR
ncbi:conserved hypothetical protein [Flavobacterium sp. 9AF]|uniref:DUF4255 domain-containing protein n=1 Tax=Flavobacterium sp. 9AF TaxID=2653142 RepID=UPI0012F2C48F|nr:DUF4255 domain-containing protein [Flavobacterium sp. 9AF]VXB30500.1 conserved hypothetical protein [Flavobacterium sp. 9AF]